ncbi:unnamed protein product [Vitrella brassicaformis CCMP3155]|uniref:Uncharacterized protein n=1 Tax=Vitrella brassicaformis (strain CCMP3155) TaxID=1169540 RepID=A0A0G4E8T4_VITBC|nr:unnamed protein product [Vitrella brassicaformis CCMP3155]|eukprot:CEL92301.1 unnamed protein product [Vitrella brassicaformis CCMP3155]
MLDRFLATPTLLTAGDPPTAHCSYALDPPLLDQAAALSSHLPIACRIRNSINYSPPKRLRHQARPRFPLDREACMPFLLEFQRRCEYGEEPAVQETEQLPAK